MSLAPSWTARARTAFSSTRSKSAATRAALSGLRRDARAAQALHDPQREAHEAVRLLRVRDVAAQESGGEAPDDRDPRDPEDEARKTIERQLRLPRRRERAAERGGEPMSVLVEARDPALEELERRLRRDPRAHERLVHPVAGERVDETRGVAHEQQPSANRRLSLRAHRQPVSAQAFEPLRREPVAGAGARQVLA